MEITVLDSYVYVEVSDCGWIGVVYAVVSFQAATLGELIDLIKLTLERI